MSFSFALAILLFSSCNRGTKVAEINKKAPNYTFIEVLNSPQTSISIAEMKGKPIILEFWATWCSGCIPAMIKLDSLQKKLNDQIEIITVSFDDKERLRKYISNTDTKLKIAWNSVHQETFRYQTIPHAIIIDKDGIIRSITSPENINEEVIQKLLSTNEIDLPLKDDFLSDSSNVNVIYQSTDSDKSIRLTSYNPTKGTASYTGRNSSGRTNSLDFQNLPLYLIYSNLFHISSYKRIVFRDSLKITDFDDEDKKYNLTIEVSEKIEEEIYDLGIKYLNDNFDINPRMVNDSLDCFVLVDEDKKIRESASEKFEYNEIGYFHGQKIKISFLSSYLERLTPNPVIDKTGLTNRYDIDLNWQKEDPQTLHTELKKYGLTLKKSETKLSIEVLEVYKKKK